MLWRPRERCRKSVRESAYCWVCLFAVMEMRSYWVEQMRKAWMEAKQNYSVIVLHKVGKNDGEGKSTTSDRSNDE